MIELPNKKKCYNLPEQVAQNLLNIQYLAEQYKNIDALPAIWQTYKEEFDSELETFEGWERTFGGWETTLATYLASMSSAAVGAIAGQNIAPANIAATGNITAPSIIESMSGYSASFSSGTSETSAVKVYVGAVKNGNKLTLICAGTLERTGQADSFVLCAFTVPDAVLNKLYPVTLGGGQVVLDSKKVDAMYSQYDSASVVAYLTKGSVLNLHVDTTNLTQNKVYYFRYEATFLLSDSL